MLLSKAIKSYCLISPGFIRSRYPSIRVLANDFRHCRLQMACSIGVTSGEFRGSRNRLGLERSPYLLQHANNPVDWFAWGPEAFNKAKTENKPIFLSVGYSTCHWCHVMERESFENEEIGRLLNEKFVSIKVDREERPDIDRVYMTFVQATSGGGGWPMSVWLTPDLKPIVGGTYFPPEDRYYGQPGFKTILNKIATAWNESPDELTAQGQTIIEALGRAVSQREGDGDHLPDCTKGINKCFKSLSTSYDDKMGGFGQAPKFPQPVNFNFLLQLSAWYKRNPLQGGSSGHDDNPGQRALDMALHTLRMMARGGIHDHVGQGFHRYSTDEDWHVPHFEKMLYDQAQLAVSYADAYQISKDEVFADVARDILSYVNRDLSDKSGGFYSAEDADSLPAADSREKREGAFCVWTHQEVEDLLGCLPAVPARDGQWTTADVFSHHYKVQPDGNVHVYKDPHGELTKQNVLIERYSVEETASHFNLSADDTRTALSTGRQILWQRRQQRPRPHLDNKMITAWNGLMISAFARAGQVLNDETYVQRAVRAAEFVRSNLFQSVGDGGDGRLLRSCYVEPETDAVTCGNPPIAGFVDDYAMMVRACLDLYESCHDESWLQFAASLQRIQDALFWDDAHSAYFSTTSNDASIVLRLKDDQDNAEPSSNSIAARNLLRLGTIMDSPDYRQRAEMIFKAFAKQLEMLPIAVPEMLTALMIHSSPELQIIIVGSPMSKDTQALLHCIRSHYLPRKSLVLLGPEESSLEVRGGADVGYLRSRRQSLQSFRQTNGRATAYVCDNHTCSLPVDDVEQLGQLLPVG